MPMVSVIMPVRNEACYIQRSLDAVLTQNYPPDRLEILIVDGMSTDETRKVIQQTLGHSSNASRFQRASVQFLDNPSRFAPFALNIGLHHAQGEVIILVGGHCEIAPDYVHRCVELLEKTGADCVGGPLVTAGDTHMARGIALAQSSFFGVGGVAFRTRRNRPGYVDTVAFGAYRRQVFDRLGKFDEELVRNQDDEFNFRLTQSGGKIWLDPSIRSTYYSRASLGRLWHQYFQYGLYKVRLIQKRNGVPSWRHLVPATFVLALLGSLALALTTRQPLWGVSVAGPYLLADLLVTFWTARRDWRTLPVLPLAFTTIHLAYGLGFLWGLWRWWGKWKRKQVGK
jgi:succinoglycan biosynthesis protein ExoA